MGGGTALIIREERTEGTGDEEIIYYDKTYQEVKDAFDAGLPIYLQQPYSGTFSRLPLANISDSTSGSYLVAVADFDSFSSITLESESADGQLHRSSGK